MPDFPIPRSSQQFYLAFERLVGCTSPSASSSCHHLHSFNDYLRPILCSHLRRRNIQQYRQTTSAAIQPNSPGPRPPTHYELFPRTLSYGPPPSGPFPIDLQSLKREFLQLQAKAHPDRHSGADKSRAEGTSALINEAYKTLSDPLLRAQYILSLHGINVAEDETIKIDDPELLGEVLEIRELIEGAQSEADIEGLRTENDVRLEDSVKTVGEKCEAGDWDGAKSEAVKLRYWVNIKEALREWEPGKPVVLIH